MVYEWQHNHCIRCHGTHYVYDIISTIYDVTRTVCMTTQALYLTWNPFYLGYNTSHPDFMTSNHRIYDITPIIFDIVSTATLCMSSYELHLTSHPLFMISHHCMTSHSLSSFGLFDGGEGNGKPLQYSCLENPMNSMKSKKIWYWKMNSQGQQVLNMLLEK